MPIDALNAAAPAPAVAAVPAPARPSTGFGESLENMIRAVEDTGAEANTAVANMLGGGGDVHTALIALQNADTTFQLSVQVRNKLVQAYQDVMRMPV